MFPSPTTSLLLWGRPIMLWMPFLVREPSPIRRWPKKVLTPAQGFSFSGEVRDPFPAVIKALEETKIPVTSVDAPSSWDIENGPPTSELGSHFHPAVLVSLTAPKPLVKYFRGRHFVGGRCVPLVLLFSSRCRPGP